jgi:hypothetical protein
MNDTAWAAVVREILRRERRSLLQFVGEAYPWTRPDEHKALEQLRKVIAEEEQAAVRLTGFLQRRHIPVPYPGSYPFSYTSLFFVSLDFLLPPLLEEQRKTIAELETDLAKVGDAGARQQVQQLLDVKRRHLKTLEELASATKAVHV